MNVAQKTRTSKSTSRGRLAKEGLSFVVDPDRALLVSATKPACRLWGLSSADTQFPMALDRAMPALATLARTASAGGDARQAVPLLFWTRRGARLWHCHVLRAGRGGSSSRTLLVMPTASAWTLLDTLDRDPVACLAHELRTPLATIQSYADLLLETQALGSGNLSAKSYATSIRQAARHGLEVVTRLLRRDGLDVAEPILEPVSLGAAVKDAVTALRPLTAKAGAQIEVVTTSSWPDVMSDAVIVAQILLNLIVNAVRHAGPAAHITVRHGRDGKRRAWLEIADTGAGFPAEVLGRFASGTSGGGSDDRHPESRRHDSGIGLALSHTLANRAGAHLSLSNRTCGGAVARLIFEATARRRKAAAAP